MRAGRRYGSRLSHSSRRRARNRQVDNKPPNSFGGHGLRTLYVSGEESPQQIKMRAERIGVENDQCLIYADTLLENIISQIDRVKPQLVVIDSIQTIYTETIDSSAGSVSQIRECAASLLKYAKTHGVSVIIIGHITKEGTIAGPKILEHIVDVVLQFEGDGNNIYRILLRREEPFRCYVRDRRVRDACRRFGAGRKSLGDTSFALRRSR